MQTRTLFTNYILAGVEASLARVQAAGHVVPDADRQQAWHLLSFALKSAEAWPATRALLLALAPRMEMAGFRENWIPYLETGWQVAQQQDDGEAVAECELQLGMLYRLQSRYAEAQRWTEASVAHFAAHANDTGQARALNELAWLEQLEGRYDAATDHVEQALALLPADDPQRAMCYRVQGMIAVEQENLLQAEAYHREALAIFEQSQDTRRFAWALQNLAYTVEKLGKMEEAIVTYQKALTILEEIQDRTHAAIVRLNLSYLFLTNQMPQQAVTHLLEARKAFTQHFNQQLLARSLSNLGLAYLSLQEYSKAEEAFLQSMNLYEILGLINWYLNAMDGLSTVYIAINERDKAVNILYKGIELLPTVTDEPNYDYLVRTLHQHLRQAEQ